MKILNTLIFLAFTLFLQAQQDSVFNTKNDTFSALSLQVMYQNGYVFATNEFLRGLNSESEKINAYQAVALKFSKQTTGKKLWEQLYKYPYWGIGLYVADFHNPKEIGIPIAVYGFLNAPFIRWNYLTFNYELGFGLTFNWKSFNPITNQYNQSIGAGESVLIDAGLNLGYRITKRIELNAGFSLTHFSNGALKKPNLGLNTIAPRISFRYNFFKPPDFQCNEIPEFNHRNEWLFSVYGGAKNVIIDTLNIDIIEKYEGVYYPELGLSFGYYRLFSYKSKIGLGMTFSYDGSVNAQVAIDKNELEPVNGKPKDNIMISIYPSYEIAFNKVSIVLQPSFYLYRKKLDVQSPVFHQRIGLLYHFTNKIFCGITLRAYKLHISDFIEWKVGYRICQK